MSEINLENMSFEELQKLQREATDELARKAASGIKDTLDLALKQINEVDTATKKELKGKVRQIVGSVFGEEYGVTRKSRNTASQSETDWKALGVALKGAQLTSKSAAVERSQFPEAAKGAIGSDWFQQGKRPSWLKDDGGKGRQKKWYVDSKQYDAAYK